MKYVLAAFMMTLLMPVSDVWANPQHDRMRECNRQAKESDLRGDERKAFMKACLSGKHDVSASSSDKPEMNTAAAETAAESAE